MCKDCSSSSSSLSLSFKLLLLYANNTHSSSLTPRSFYLPGDTLPLTSSDHALCTLLRGDLYVHRWTESLGEVPIERRDVLSLLGTAAHPSDGQQLVRITAEDVAAIASVSASAVQKVGREASGIHKQERFKLIHSMQNHPLFQGLSFRDLYRLSYYFYKVELEQGDILSREGTCPSFAYYISSGSVERTEHAKQGWAETTRTLRQGTFPAISALAANSGSDATYTVASDHTVVYVCNPSVIWYFIGGRYTALTPVLQNLRDPTSDAMVTATKEIVEGMRFYRMSENVSRLHDGLQAIQSASQSAKTSDSEKVNPSSSSSTTTTSSSSAQTATTSSANELLHSQVSELVHLLQATFPEEVREDQDVHKEGISYALSVGTQILQALQLPWLINTIYSYFTTQPAPDSSSSSSMDNREQSSEIETESDNSKDSERESTTTLIDETKFNDALAHFLHRNNLNDYTDAHVLSLLTALRYEYPAQSAAYLLFIMLSGISEPCMITRDLVEKQATLAGILTEDNTEEIMDFFFHSKNTLDFDDYWKKMTSSPSSIPKALHSYLSRLDSIITHLCPSQQDHFARQAILRQRHRHQDPDATLHLHSPFHLLPLPLPLPYPMVFAVKRESFSADYKKYAIGGILGEVFVGIEINMKEV